MDGHPSVTAALAAAACLLALIGASPPASAGDFLDAQRRFARVDAAWRAHRVDVRARFDAAGAAWPPRGLFLRAFKGDDVVELWAAQARGGRLVRVRTFAVCARSGGLGPKAARGDLQVPEGFYRIDRFNPRSRFHLSLGLDYPNAVDRARAGPRAPGGDIFLHGACVTIGCLPLEDGPMAWLYLAAVLARDAGQRELPVHLFPCRFGERACEDQLATAAAASPELSALWASLRAAHAAFEATGRVPRTRATARGYEVTRVDP